MKQINILTRCSEITIKGNKITIKGNNPLEDLRVLEVGMQFTGYISLDATEEAVKDSLDESMLQLQSLLESYHEYGLGDDAYYDYVPDFMDQIVQLVYHALDLHVTFEVQKYVDTTVAFWETIYKEDGEVNNPFSIGNIKYIENHLVKESHNIK